jgi:hypothetical protein
MNFQQLFILYAFGAIVTGIVVLINEWNNTDNTHRVAIIVITVTSLGPYLFKKAHDKYEDSLVEEYNMHEYCWKRTERCGIVVIGIHVACIIGAYISLFVDINNFRTNPQQSYYICADFGIWFLWFIITCLNSIKEKCCRKKQRNSHHYLPETTMLASPYSTL